MRRLISIVVLLGAGCGRTGVPLEGNGSGGGAVCGPGTYESGGVCWPLGSGGSGGGGGGFGGGGGGGFGGGGGGGFGGGGGGGGGGFGGGGGGGGGGTPSGPPPPVGSAVGYQIDAAHTGGQPSSTLKPPLVQRWSLTLGSDNLSYPLIVDGRVFVTGSGSNGGRLYALSASTGSTLWGPTAVGSGAVDVAWDDGKLFTISASGLLQAFDAATGGALWSRSVGSPFSIGPPVAAAGQVFVAVGGSLLAFDAHSGAPRWQGGSGGDPTSPAWTEKAIVLEYISGTLSSFDPGSGATLWHDQGCCSGGGGDTPVIYEDRVFARDFWQMPNGVYSLADGQVLSSFAASTLPAFENGLGFFRSDATLEGHDLLNNVLWSFAGDGALDSTPIAAGGVVYIGSSMGNLYAVDEKNGHQLWTDHLAAAVAPSNDTDGQRPMTGLAASLDLLVVPAGSTLTAYGN